jgi:hypothetical protein
MSDFTILMSFWASVISQIFALLDSVYFGDYTVLTIFVALEFASITLWGISTLIKPDSSNGGE